jgi:SecD/SecF fusion protein
VLAIGAVYVFGGETIRDVAFGLVVSIITGGYSSIFNASPILVDWHNWAERRRGTRQAAAPPDRAPGGVPDRTGATNSEESPAAPLGAGSGGPRVGGGRRRGGKRRR